MRNEATLQQLCGALRWPTFKVALEWIYKYRPPVLIETGCYRGTPADGESTILLSMAAKDTHASFYSFELNPEHIMRARRLLEQKGLVRYAKFIQGDSIASLEHFKPRVGFAYLDSFDHDINNPGPSQQHQLKELVALLPLVRTPAAILMDDNVAETGGKPKLAAPRLAELGWVKAAEGYQFFYTSP